MKTAACCGVAVWAAAALLGCSANSSGTGGGQRGGGLAGSSAAGGGGGAAGTIPGGGGTGAAGTSSGGGGTGAAGTGGGGTGTLLTRNDCPGPVSAANEMALRAPNVATTAPMRWLYPYEFTVFPRGLESPLLQWDEPAGGSAEAVYLHLRSQLYDYHGCLPPTAPGQLQIPQDVWEQAGTQSKGASDPLTMELTTLTAGTASRLPPRKLTFALAQLKNAIYYNTYGSALANQMNVVGGVVMRITPKQTQPDVFLTAQNTLANCIGCHAVSANGSRLVAEEHINPGLGEATGGIYDLSSNMLRPAPAVSLKRAGFSALYPDGSVYLTTARGGAGPFGGGGNVVTGTFGPEVSKLIRTADGTEIPGTGIVPYALMPMFATDGKMVIFNHLSDTGVGGHDLSVMGFDIATNQFSGLKKIYSNPSLFIGWPTFLPDVQLIDQENPVVAGRRAVFVLGSVGDYVTQEAPAGVTPHVSDLWWIDVDSGMAAPLLRAGGFEGATNFMPYGARDAHRDYMPTVSPVAAGGYFWLFFSSRRHYGNELVYQNENDNAGKKIWVAAIDINAAPGSDPSHPAFYLPGQESESGNVRAFAALTPCKVDGQSCETGIDCCSGFCLNGICGAPPMRCSELDEGCTTTKDCCEGKGLSCIGGFCGYIVPE